VQALYSSRELTSIIFTALVHAVACYIGPSASAIAARQKIAHWQQHHARASHNRSREESATRTTKVSSQQSMPKYLPALTPSTTTSVDVDLAIAAFGASFALPLSFTSNVEFQNIIRTTIRFAQRRDITPDSYSGVCSLPRLRWRAGVRGAALLTRIQFRRRGNTRTTSSTSSFRRRGFVAFERDRLCDARASHHAVHTGGERQAAADWRLVAAGRH